MPQEIPGNVTQVIKSLAGHVSKRELLQLISHQTLISLVTHGYVIKITTSLGRTVLEFLQTLTRPTTVIIFTVITVSRRRITIAA